MKLILPLVLPNPIISFYRKISEAQLKEFLESTEETDLCLGTFSWAAQKDEFLPKEISGWMDGTF